MRLLIVGCGDLGIRVAKQMVAHGWQVLGLRRDVAALPDFIEPIAADLNQPLSLQGLEVDYLLYSVAADSGDEAAYRRAYVEGLREVLTQFKARPPRQMLFISSTSVYGQHDGEWVDEQSQCAPEYFTGQVMLEAETLALQSTIPATVVRLAGLYDPARPWLINQIKEGAWLEENPVHYANRIHREDAAGLVAQLFANHAQGAALAPVYLGVDDAPVNLYEVVEWLRGQLGVEAKTRLMTRRSGSKRCNNALAKTTGWTLAYPNYRQGYALAVKSGA